MRTLNKLLFLFLALSLATSSVALADKAKDGDKNKKRAAASTSSVSKTGGLPDPGSCTLGTAQKDLDINNVRARVFNTGSLFYGNGAEAQYVVPKASENSPIYATGVWVGGMVGDEVPVMLEFEAIRQDQ